MSKANQNDLFEQVTHTICPDSRLLRSWPLPGGFSARMTALELEHPGGELRRMIVRQPGPGTLKRNPQAAQSEFQLLQLTQALGLPTQRPYYLDQSGTIFAAPYLVIEYIEGQPEFPPAAGADCILQLATNLARIHQADCSDHDLTFLPKHQGEYSEHRDQRSISVDQSFDEERIRAVLESIWPFQQPNPAALLHGDFWPGNVLWHNAKLVAVIDWEDAKIGDPLSDFAISRLDILWILGLEAMGRFTSHYISLMPLDYTGLAYWELNAALRLARLAESGLADWVAFFHEVGRYDITEATLREHYHLFVNQAFEQLKLAV